MRRSRRGRAGDTGLRPRDRPVRPAGSGSLPFEATGGPNAGERIPVMENAQVKLTEVLTPRRLVTTALLLLALVLAVYGMQHVTDTNRATTCGAGNSAVSPVKVLYSCPGDDGLRQGRIGVSLAQGYTTDLFVDGTPIPTYQLVIEGSDFFYLPGPDKITGALSPGSHLAELRYRKLSEETAAPIPYVWWFTTN